MIELLPRGMESRGMCSIGMLPMTWPLCCIVLKNLSKCRTLIRRYGEPRNAEYRNAAIDKTTFLHRFEELESDESISRQSVVDHICRGRIGVGIDQ